MCFDSFLPGVMEEVVRLGESSQCPSTQLPTDGEDDFGGDYVDIQAPAPFREPTISPVLNDPPQPASARSSSCHLNRRVRLLTRFADPIGARPRCLCS